MFSKALFKQSCKANGIMWIIITSAVCFMLACVMLISGSGNLGEIKDNIQNTIIEKTIESNIKTNGINTYEVCLSGNNKFDELYVTVFYEEAAKSDNLSAYSNAYLEAKSAGYSDDEAQAIAFKSAYIAPTYTETVSRFNTYIASYAQAVNSEYTVDSEGYKTIYGTMMFSVNPNGAVSDKYIEYGETSAPDEFITNLIPYLKNDMLSSSESAKEYISSNERISFREDRASTAASILVSYNATNSEAKRKMIESLSDYSLTEETYDSFGFTYDNVKKITKSTCLSYQARYDYELSLLDNESRTMENINKIKSELGVDLSGSFLEFLPESVSTAIKEIGAADMYGLIVGSIFFKIAGLLLPIIYMIMVANNLIVGQVDTGSMAYVLSTSTKRNQVTFTQTCFLIGSLAVMFVLTTITSIICYFIADVETSLNVGKLVLINLGAFLVLFAMSGINFFTSCWYDRSKKSMAIGGGLSMFFLVATMLGLFGSPVIPSVIRIEALNNFNFVSIISLFDVVSILHGELDFIWKLFILVVIGVVGYIGGAIKFKKKDLPL